MHHAGISLFVHKFKLILKTNLALNSNLRSKHKRKENRKEKKEKGKSLLGLGFGPPIPSPRRRSGWDHAPIGGPRLSARRR